MIIGWVMKATNALSRQRVFRPAKQLGTISLSFYAFSRPSTIFMLAVAGMSIPGSDGCLSRSSWLQSACAGHTKASPDPAAGAAPCLGPVSVPGESKGAVPIESALFQPDWSASMPDRGADVDVSSTER